MAAGGRLVYNFSRVGEWPFSASCGERLFLSVSDILTDSVAEFDSCDYEHQQFDDLRNVHVLDLRSYRRVGAALVSMGALCSCASALPYPVVEVPAVRLPGWQLHHAAAALSPSSDEQGGRVSRGSYMREMPDQTKPQVKGQKIICGEIVASGIKTSVNGISRTTVRT